MHPSILQSKLSNLQPGPHKFPPLTHLCMPLQPRRTWSAEDERRRRLEEDPDAYDVGPHSVTCAGCHRPIRLNATGRYYAANWNKHKMGCKNANAVNGANAMSVESKFTGRVAAFRVAKPTEIPDSSSIPTVSASSANLGILHDLTQNSEQLPHRQFAGERWSDEQIPSGTNHDSGIPPSQSHRYMSASNGNASHRLLSSHLYETSHTHTQPPASGAIGSDRCQMSPRLKMRSHSNSPKGPPLRLFEREAYGLTSTPHRTKRFWNDRHFHGMPFHGVRQLQEDSSTRHHSENTTHRAAYLHTSETQRLLDKGKERYIDFRRSDSHRHFPSRTSELSKTSFHEGVRIGGARVHDGGNSLDLNFFHPVVSEEGSPSSTGWSRTEGHDLSDLDSSSTASPRIFNTPRPRGPQDNHRSLPPNVTQQSNNRSDDRVLPPLSSLSLVQKEFSSGATPSLDYICDSGSKEHADWEIVVSSEERPMWRRRTTAWVQSTAARPAVGCESPESVVLPPIRRPSIAPLVGHRAMKNRQRKGDGSDDDCMDNDRISPPKSFPLPADSSSSSSTLLADDLSFKYKRKNVPMEEGAHVGGDSMFVGKHSGSSKEITTVSTRDAGRLHPVWKWEHKREDLEQGSSHKGGENAVKMGDVS